MTKPDGSRGYEGEFHGGMFHGPGTLIRADGDRHEGEFRDGWPFDGVITYSFGGRSEVRNGESVD